jgi:hypothetical protein
MAPLELKRAPPDIQSTKAVAVAALEAGQGAALEFCSPALRADPEIVLLATRQNGFAMSFADPALKSDKTFLLSVFRNCRALDGESLRSATAAMRADPEVVAAACAKDPWALAYASNDLKSNKAFMKRLREECQASEAVDYFTVSNE